MNNTLVYITLQLLKKHKIAIDIEELTFQIKSHPSYPSLQAITGVLDHFNVDNLALDVPKNEQTLTQLPKIFLAQIETENGKEFAIIKKDGLHYNLTFSEKKKSKVSLNAFLEQFTGIIVAVEKTELTQEKTDKNNVLNQILIGICTLAFFGTFLYNKPSLFSSLFFVTSIIGILISITFKKQEQGEQTLLGNAFCSGASEVKDCDTVLASKGANVFGNFKLSDLSLVYFSGLSLLLFSLTLLSESLTLPYIISVIAFPVTLYSIYYQAIVLKKWCFLCMSVVAILWVQTLFFVLNFNLIVKFSFSIQSVLLTALSFILASTIWSVLLPQLKTLQELKDIKVDYYKFKRNFNLFNTLLEQSKPVNTKIEDENEIVLGNPNTKLEITIVTNPFCGHCKAVQTLVETIYKKHADKVKVHIRFNVGANDTESSLVKIISRLIELYNTKGAEVCIDAMHKIYNGQDSKLWLEEFGACTNTSLYFETLKKEKDWCADNAINFTPAILINGKSYPREYDRSDLIYFIEDLYEETTNSKLLKQK